MTPQKEAYLGVMYMLTQLLFHSASGHDLTTTTYEFDGSPVHLRDVLDFVEDSVSELKAA